MRAEAVFLKKDGFPNEAKEVLKAGKQVLQRSDDQVDTSYFLFDLKGDVNFPG